MVEQQPIGSWKRLGRRPLYPARDEIREAGRLPVDTSQLLRDAAPGGVEHDMGGGEQQSAIRLLHPDGADDEHAARLITPGVGTGLDQGALDVRVHLRRVSLGPLVEDHHVGGDSPTPPESMGTQHRDQDRGVFR